MTRIYWTPHKSRRREHEFVACLHAYFGGELLNERFPLAPASLNYLLESSKLITWLDADHRLPLSRRKRCIEQLIGLPSHICVATKMSSVSFDVVIQRAGHTYYWEFHEEQHRNLKDDRPKAIFGPDGRNYDVPRYLQRLLRDIWKIKAFPNVNIVWEDWFASIGRSNPPSMIHGFREYHLEHRFSFKTFCAEDLLSLV